MSDTETSIRCVTCGREVPDMDYFVDHVTNCHNILDVIVDGVSDYREVMDDA